MKAQEVPYFCAPIPGRDPQGDAKAGRGLGSSYFSISSAATFRFSYSLSLRARTMLGVSGAKSFSGFIAAAWDGSWSLATQPVAAGTTPGPGESAAPRCHRRRLMDHAAPSLPVSLCRRAMRQNPGLDPSVPHSTRTT